MFKRIFVKKSIKGDNSHSLKESNFPFLLSMEDDKDGV